ncbi:hypothetical protein ABLV58_11980 [Klebsiella sp. JB_Kp046]|uniref:hypothetical protein n=1 Tax=Klebsiella sp. JB_Kp046 TaxID=3153398 RepID=UPI0032B3C0EF
MSSMNISDAQCHVEQALAVLSVWLEVASVADDVREFNMISSLISLLDGVPEAIQGAEGVLHDLAMKNYKAGKDE